MMKYVGIFLLALTLGACATKPPVVLDQTKIVAVSPPATLFNCPVILSFPDPDKLTNKQLAKLIKTLYENNQTCSINMQKIEEFVKKAKVNITNVNLGAN